MKIIFSITLSIVDSREIGLYFVRTVGSSFLNRGITLAIYNSAGRMFVSLRECFVSSSQPFLHQCFENKLNTVFICLFK